MLAWAEEHGNSKVVSDSWKRTWTLEVRAVPEVLGAWMRHRSSGNERGVLPQGWRLRNKLTAATKAAGRISKLQEAIHQESSLPEVTKEAASSLIRILEPLGVLPGGCQGEKVSL